MRGWLNSPIANSANLLILKFEEIHRDVESAVAQALKFLGMKTHPDAIHRACVNNSIEKMRAKEAQSKTLPRTGEGGGLIRSGTAQGWRSILNSAQTALIERHAGATLQQLGYDVDTSVAHNARATSTKVSRTLHSL